jgi:4-methoxybenzoate monooxygenase (O-demethylating)
MVTSRSPFAIYESEPPAGVPILDVDPFTTPYFDDPYPFQERMREAGPYFWLSRYGIGAVARYQGVRDTLIDWQTFCSSRGVGMEDFERHGRFRLRSLILEADPPGHDVSRRVLARTLSATTLNAFRIHFEKRASALIDTILEMRSFDGISDVARAYPLDVFPDAVGMKEEGRERLLPHADALFNSFGPRNELFQASAAKANFAWIEEQGRRENLRAGGLGLSIHEAADRGEISPEAATMLVRSLLQAGLDTTVNSLAAALHALAKYPEEWRKLRANPALAKNAFDEAIRFESPVQTFFRTATKSTELGGVPVREGDKVLLFLGAANRDPRKWHGPDQYDITRKGLGHVGFGAGIHACVGQLLAKLEGEILLGALALRAREISLDGQPTRHYNNTIRGWSRMPMRVVPA